MVHDLVVLLAHRTELGAQLRRRRRRALRRTGVARRDGEIARDARVHIRARLALA